MDKTVAILARTNRSLAPVEQALSAEEIPFFYLNRSGFFAQPEIRTILAYLGCVNFPADYLLSACIKTSLWPAKFLPKTRLLARLKELQNSKEPSYWNLLTQEPESLVESKNLGTLRDFTSFIHGLSRYKSLSAENALKQVLTVLKAVDYYNTEEVSVDSDPLENLSTLVKISKRFGTVKEFLDYARKVTAASKKKSGVALSTIHAAKGLEFHSVYLIQCSEGILPHAKSNDLEGEANCFFVGCSRAERELIITYSGQPSGFLKKEKNDTSVAGN